MNKHLQENKQIIPILTFFERLLLFFFLYKNTKGLHPLLAVLTNSPGDSLGVLIAPLPISTLASATSEIPIRWNHPLSNQFISSPDSC